MSASRKSLEAREIARERKNADRLRDAFRRARRREIARTGFRRVAA